MKGAIDMKKETKVWIGLIILFIGLFLLGSVFYALWQSFHGHMFEYDPLVGLAKFVGSIICISIGGNLIAGYKM